MEDEIVETHGRYETKVGKPERMRPLGDFGVDGRII
jgi:hypothetical protein